MSKDPIKVTRSDALVLRGMEKDVVRWRKNEGPKGDPPSPPDTFQGALVGVVSSVGGIPAATSALATGRGTIKIRKLWFRADNMASTDMDIVSPYDQPKLFGNIDDDFVECNCYNISTTIAWGYGDYVIVLPLAGGRFLAVSGGSGGNDTASSSNACGCFCIEEGDITVGSIVTTSQWYVVMPEVVFEQANGTITFPSGSYLLTYASVAGLWTLDIGAYLTSAYNDGHSATSATTMDGTLAMEWGASVSKVNLCVDGTVPAHPGTGTGSH